MIFISPRLSLPVVVVVLALAVSALASAQARSIGTTGKLEQLMDMIKRGQGRPSSEDVVEAYHEYVALHKLQNELADNFGGQQAEQKPEDERRYNEEQDYTLGEVIMSEKLDESLSSAIKSLFS